MTTNVTPLNIIDLMRVVMDADQETRGFALRGTTNWAAHIGKAVQNAVLAKLDTTPAVAGEPLTDSYVQIVPDKCDRIVWRNHYYHLPLSPPPPVLAGAKEAAEHYRNAIANACEGWTMPDGLRKHLEAALWSAPAMRLKENK